MSNIEKIRTQYEQEVAAAKTRALAAIEAEVFSGLPATGRAIGADAVLISGGRRAAKARAPRSPKKIAPVKVKAKKAASRGARYGLTEADLTAVLSSKDRDVPWNLQAIIRALPGKPSAAAVRRVVGKLIEAGAVRTSGERRAMVYYRT